jgi:hypothetical protein
MISRLSLLFLPVLLVAQEQAPPDVEQELRARVTAFYQNFVDGSPRKAEAFVAEDTKDYYYNAGKMHFESFRIEKVTFSDNFTKAVVAVSGKTQRLIAGQVIMMDIPQETRWKIEDGKWCWTYHQEDFGLTPMSPRNPPPPTAEERATAVRPKDTSLASIRAAGAAVLEQQPMGLDKGTVTMSVEQPGSAEVVFTNGADNDISIALDGPVVRGLKAKLDKTTVPGHGKAVLTLVYDPSDKTGPKDVWEPKGNIPFRIVAAPFNRIFPVNVQFIGPQNIGPK